MEVESERNGAGQSEVLCSKWKIALEKLYKIQNIVHPYVDVNYDSEVTVSHS